MTLSRWTSRLRWLSGCHHHRRLYLFILWFLMTSLTLTRTIDASSSSSSLHKRQYDVNTLHLLHRDYLYEEKGRAIKRNENDDDDDAQLPPLSSKVLSSRKKLEPDVLKRETAGVNMLKSSKDALIVTKKSYLKKDWCKTEPLIQRIKEPGCVTRTIVNRFCYGQCNSFYIPKDSTKVGTDDNSFKSCSFCKPKRFRWITITLTCPHLDPPFKRKRIQRVKKCKCITEILQS